MAPRVRAAMRRKGLWRFAWVPLGLAAGALLIFGFEWIRAPAPPAHIPPLQVHQTFPPEITDSNIQLSHVFEVRNPSDQPVRILGMKTSCACTSAELGTRQLGPRESTELHFSARVPLTETTERLVVQLQTDLRQQPVWIYSVSVDRYSPITLRPKQLLLGDPRPGAAVEQSFYIEVHSFDDKPVESPEFEFGRRLESFSVVQDGDPIVTRLDDGVVRTTSAFTLKGTVGRTQGQQMSEIQMRLAGFTEGTALSLPVGWNVQGAISVDPLRVFFGAVRHGQTLTRRAVLASADRTPFRILRFESTSPIVRAAVASASESTLEAVVPLSEDPLVQRGPAWEQVEVEISLDGEFEGKFLRGKVVVVTDHADYPEVQIGFTAIRRSGSDTKDNWDSGS